jgi:hypothetical protein
MLQVRDADRKIRIASSFLSKILTPFHSPCGSTISGHRRDLLTMMPFSTLKASMGRPAMFHALMATGSPKVKLSEKIFEQGMSFSKQS